MSLGSYVDSGGNHGRASALCGKKKMRKSKTMSDKLDSDIDVEVEKLSNQYGSDFEGEVLGYGMMYSTGADFNCLVPRDWLLETVDELDIPEKLVPSETTPYYAYTRTIKRFKEDWDKERELFLMRKDDKGKSKHRVVVDLKKGDGSNVYHFSADVLYSEDETGIQGGLWESKELGYVIYDSEQERLKAHSRESLEEGGELEELWVSIAQTAADWHHEMKNVHHSTDIRDMVYKSVSTYSDTVIKLKRGVYLFPAGMGDFLDSMAEFYRRINDRFKTTGEPMALRTFEVLNTEEKQEWVETRVRQSLEESLDDLLEKAFESIEEGEASSDVVESVIDNLDETDHTAETYSSLLQAEISVESLLEEKKSEVEDDREEIVEGVIDKIEF